MLTTSLGKIKEMCKKINSVESCYSLRLYVYDNHVSLEDVAVSFDLELLKTYFYSMDLPHGNAPLALSGSECRRFHEKGDTHWRIVEIDFLT
jgi:hypothetical protein